MQIRPCRTTPGKSICTLYIVTEILPMQHMIQFTRDRQNLYILGESSIHS